MLVGKPEDEIPKYETEAVRSPHEFHTTSVLTNVALQLRDEIVAYQARYLARWRESQLDALIMPVQPFVGFKPKTWVKSNQYVGYTAMWNLLDFAALAFPTGNCDPSSIDLDAEPGDGRTSWNKHVPRNVSDEFNWKQCKSRFV